MKDVFRILLASLISVAAAIIPGQVLAQTPASDIAVVVMHGKAGSPAKWVNELALALEMEGFHVANLEMPWSKNRQYDVDMRSSANEITTALNAMRAKGAKKTFVAGHSQGGLNALLYGGLEKADGLIAIAPGGNHGAKNYISALGSYVSTAKEMIDQNRGNERAEFADMEGSKGTFPITTTAANYYDWFNPGGPHNMDYACKNVKSGTPVLYVAPTGDYPSLKKYKNSNFGMLPSHDLSRLYEPETDHLNSPSVSAPEIIRWIKEVAGK